ARMARRSSGERRTNRRPSSISRCPVELYVWVPTSPRAQVGSTRAIGVSRYSSVVRTSIRLKTTAVPYAREQSCDCRITRPRCRDQEDVVPVPEHERIRDVVGARQGGRRRSQRLRCAAQAGVGDLGLARGLVVALEEEVRFTAVLDRERIGEVLARSRREWPE